MKTVAKIIAQRGGLEGLKRKHIRIENKPYMPLVIELAGNSPRGRELRGFLRNSVLVSVAHIFVQEGDVVYDPEVTTPLPKGERLLRLRTVYLEPPTLASQPCVPGYLKLN